MARDERCVGRGGNRELEAETLRILEPQPLSGSMGDDARGVQPPLPEVQRRRGRDPEHDRVDHSLSGAAAPGTRVLEERDVRPWTAELVGVEQVVDGGVVLVDRLLHHAQPEHAGVEGDVAGGVPGDARDVVDALEPHRTLLRDGISPYLEDLRGPAAE